ncbi:hypothetical protein Ddye_028798 [Dipteronia dyeriana]|uniref:Uncharacterized protein n=1 Tax=Dipteronia dyeriana TaxID=168575 RepID=A0AAD9WK02_9ROSI|nr:hypothetical protein Ddye_028798 [Dipteronia dyeriana]
MQNLLKKSDALRNKIQTLDSETKASLDILKKREVTIDGSVEIAMEQLEDRTPYSTISHVKKKRNGTTLTVKSMTTRRC